MRPRFLICISAVVLFMVEFVFWLRSKHQNVVIQPKQEIVQSTNQPARNAIVSDQHISRPVLSQTNRTPLIPSSVGIAEVTKSFVDDKNKPINLFVRFIDQSSNPVPEVKVKFGIMQLTALDPALMELGSKSIQLERTTDGDGRIEIHGEVGEGIGIGTIQKDGYEPERAQYSFGTVGGSFDNPIIVKMWSTNIHEQLITGEKTFDIAPDGKPHVIDLLKGTIAEAGDGDLTVWIQYTNQVTRGQVYDWSAGIKIINGGLFEEDLGSPMYDAPPDGYVPTFEIHGKIKGGQRGDSGDRQFYLKLKNGQEFGQMSIDLHAPFNDQTPGLINLSYVINPSGSRILR